MAGAEGGLGGNCFFDDDCGGPQYCHVVGVGGEFIIKFYFCSLLIFLF